MTSPFSSGCSGPLARKALPKSGLPPSFSPKALTAAASGAGKSNADSPADATNINQTAAVLIRNRAMLPFYTLA
jgi:hypothetical protein